MKNGMTELMAEHPNAAFGIMDLSRRLKVSKDGLAVEKVKSTVARMGLVIVRHKKEVERLDPFQVSEVQRFEPACGYFEFVKEEIFEVRGTEGSLTFNR